MQRITGISARTLVIAPLIASLLIVLLEPGVVGQLRDGFSGDSFYTLRPAPAIGLVVLTITLCATLGWLSWLKTIALQRRFSTRSNCVLLVVGGIDLFITTALLWAAFALAPQLYYSFYLLVFPDISQQWVIRPLPLNGFITMLGVPAQPSLAAISSALFGWILVSTTSLGWLDFWYTRSTAIARSTG